MIINATYLLPLVRIAIETYILRAILKVRLRSLSGFITLRLI